MSQEPYETNSDANDMAPIDSTTEIGGGLVAAEITHEDINRDFTAVDGSTISHAEVVSAEEALANLPPDIRENMERLNRPEGSSYPALVEENLDGTFDVRQADAIDLLEMPAIPAETLAAIKEQNAKAAQLIAGDKLPKVVYIPTAAPLADAISTKTQGQPHHIQIGTIHFKNPA